MNYVQNMITGLLVFPLIAFVFTMPYAIYQYHRYGAISKLRTLIIYSFILYMLIAYFMVILPLPSRESTIGNKLIDHLNLIPFNQVMIYWSGKTFSFSAFLDYLKSFSLWQLLFNVLLTVPFGVYLHYYFRQDFRKTVFYSFLLSLFYELTQLSGLYGIYPGPYRLADIEDLICNTLGGAVGYLIAYVFMLILPKRDEIDAYCRSRGKRISGTRRFWAALFDLLFCTVLFIVLHGLGSAISPDLGKYTEQALNHLWTMFCVLSLVSVMITKGSTLGHALCRMILVSEDGSMASRKQLLIRYVSLWMLTEFPILLVSWLPDGQFTVIGDILTMLLILFSRLYFVYYFINEAFRKGARPLPHDRLSRTTYMATEISEAKK